MKPLDRARWNPFKADRLLRNYERIFEPLASRGDVRLLELGVFKGGSLAMWADYFEGGTIAGLDIRDLGLTFESPRVKVYQGSQSDTDLLSRIAADTAPGGFDIVIDDCSHLAEWSRLSFRHLFEHHLKPGGIYVIEDWCTGFIDGWPDGRALKKNFRQHRSWRAKLWGALEWLIARGPVRQRVLASTTWKRLAASGQKLPSHSYGMVGLVKQLVDEFGIPESKLAMATWIERMEIDAGQVFIFKKHKLD